MTVHNLAFQGQFPRELLASIGLPPHAYGDRRRRVLRHDRLPQGRARARRPDHHGVADLCGGDPHARGRHGARRAAAPSRGRADGHPERHRRRGVESGDRRPPRSRASTRRHLARRAANKAALQARFGLDVEPAAFLFGVVSRLTLQKGMDLLLEALPTLIRHGAQLALLGAGDKALEDGLRRRGRAASRARRRGDRLRRGARAPDAGSRRRAARAVALRALRPHPALRAALRRDSRSWRGSAASPTRSSTRTRWRWPRGTGTGIQFAPVTRGNLELAIGRAIALRRDAASWRRAADRARWRPTSAGPVPPSTTPRSSARSPRSARPDRCAASDAGSPEPLGVTPERGGANVAVFSAHATAIELCLFDAGGRDRAGAHRAARAHRRRLPRLHPRRRGRRSLRTARARPVRPAQRSPLQSGEAPRRSLRAGARPAVRAASRRCSARTTPTRTRDDTDSAPFVPKAHRDALAGTGAGRRPRVPWAQTILYELHVRGFTRTHPGVPGRAARHLRRARPPRRDRAPDAARHHDRRADADRGRRRRAPPRATSASPTTGATTPSRCSSPIRGSRRAASTNCATAWPRCRRPASR